MEVAGSRSEPSRTNVLPVVIGQSPHATKNRNRNVYLFCKGLKDYIGSMSLLFSLKFYDVGEFVPREIIGKKHVAGAITDEQFDDLDVYIPFTKDGKLITPIPASENHTISWSYTHYDCTVSGSTGWPEVLGWIMEFCA